MGLLDSLISGKPGRLASMATAQQLAQTQNSINQLLGSSESNQLAAIRGAQPLALSALKTGYDTAMPHLQTGYDTARADYGRASDLYNPYASAGLSGLNMLTNSLGLNGPQGNAAAVAAFQAGPGYEWMRDQALEGVLRKQNSMGMRMGGNTLTALQDRAGQLANQEYNPWRNQLTSLAGTGYNALNAQAGIARGQGDLATGYGQDAARTAYGYGGDVGNIYRGDAARMAQTYGNTAALGVNALSDLGRIGAQNTSAGMMAGQHVGPNTLNALLAALKLGGSALSAPLGPGGTTALSRMGFA
jgi:hypothetical protein